MEYIKRFNEGNIEEEYQEDVDDIVSDIRNETGVNINIDGPNEGGAYGYNGRYYYIFCAQGPHPRLNWNNVKKYVSRFRKCLGDDFIALNLNRCWQGWHTENNELESIQMPNMINGFCIYYKHNE